MGNLHLTTDEHRCLPDKHLKSHVYVFLLSTFMTTMFVVSVLKMVISNIMKSITFLTTLLVVLCSNWHLLCS